MRLLLDTHVLLWWLADRPLTEGVDAAIRDPGNDVLVSVASAWEIAIKVSLGKLQAPDDLNRVLAEQHFTVLDVRLPHAEAVRTLPLLHRDPFDRLLVAQAMVDGLVLATRDPAVLAYEASTLVA